MKILLVLLSILFAGYINLNAQEIKVNVTVNVDQLEFEARQQVSNMKSDLERYINNQKFTNTDWEGDPIPVDMTVFLTGGNNNRYSARLMIISYRYLDGVKDGKSPELKFFEQNWNFEYALGANLSFNLNVYNPITTIIDYYMSIIIGFDLDTYEQISPSASKAYDQAKDLVRLGASQNITGFETFTQPGQFNKFNLVSELSDLRYYELRKLFFYYFVEGLDQMAYDKKKATEALARVISDMADFKKNKLTGPSVLLQAFFDTKSEELAVIFNAYTDQTLFANLKYLDPSNSVIYDDAQSGRVGNRGSW